MNGIVSFARRPWVRAPPSDAENNSLFVLKVNDCVCVCCCLARALSLFVLVVGRIFSLSLFCFDDGMIRSFSFCLSDGRLCVFVCVVTWRPCSLFLFWWWGTFSFFFNDDDGII